MENTNSFIKDEKIKNDDNIRIINDKINYIVYQIEEIDNMIIELSKDIDSTYGIFSPNSFDKDNNVVEIEKLNIKKSELEIEKQALEENINELNERKSKIEEALEEMKEIENQMVNNVNNTKYLINKEVEKVKDQNISYVIKMLEQQINKDSHYINETFNKRLNLIKNKFDLCENFIDLDSNRARIELDKLKEEIEILIKMNNSEMFHVKHLDSNDKYVNINKSISDFIKEYKKNISYKIVYSYTGSEILEISDNCINIIRIIKEAIDNSIKYCNGSIINVNIVVDKMENNDDDSDNSVDMRQINFMVNNDNKYNIIVQISDNGDGFTLQEDSVLNANNLYGISLMRARSKLLNGTFNIESTLGMGTTVTIVYQTLGK